MKFSLLSALVLAPLALAFPHNSPENAIIARDLAGLRANLNALERRFAEASFDDDDFFGGLSARSTFEDMLFERAFPATPTDGKKTKGPQHLDGNLGRVNTKLGQFRKGSEKHSTDDKRKEIDRLASNKEKGRTNKDRHYG